MKKIVLLISLFALAETSAVSMDFVKKVFDLFCSQDSSDEKDFAPQQDNLKENNSNPNDYDITIITKQGSPTKVIFGKFFTYKPTLYEIPKAYRKNLGFSRDKETFFKNEKRLSHLRKIKGPVDIDCFSTHLNESGLAIIISCFDYVNSLVLWENEVIATMVAHEEEFFSICASNFEFFLLGDPNPKDLYELLLDTLHLYHLKFETNFFYFPTVETIKNVWLNQKGTIFDGLKKYVSLIEARGATLPAKYQQASPIIEYLAKQKLFNQKVLRNFEL